MATAVSKGAEMITDASALEGGWRRTNMGIYVNPGNKAFSRIAGKNYVDKTNLICAMNERIGGNNSPSRRKLIQSHDAPKMHPDGWVWVHRLIVCIKAV